MNATGEVDYGKSMRAKDDGPDLKGSFDRLCKGLAEEDEKMD